MVFSTHACYCDYDNECDVHVLEDLTGGIVLNQSIYFKSMLANYKQGSPMTAVKLVSRNKPLYVKCFNFYRIS